MPALKLVSSVKPAEFMKAIRFKPFAPNTMGEFEKYVERQPTLASLGTVPPWMHLSQRFGCLDQGVFERQIVATRLRMCVDEWIDTGMIRGVGEVHLKRDLVKATAAAKLLREYIEDHRPTLVLDPTRLEFVFEVCHPRVENGSLDSARRFDLVSRAFEEAARLFAGLMLSDWGQHLCRCRYGACGKYFWKERLRSAPLVHGTFCSPEHQRKASAADCVRNSRENLRRDLIDRAARILVRWRTKSPEWQKDRNRKRHLASELSTTQLYRRHRLGLGRNWVTRNSHLIEQKRLELTGT